MLSFFCPQRYRIDLTPLVTFIVASKSFPRPSAALQSLVASGTLVNVDIGAYVASPGMNVSEGYRIPGLTLHKARILSLIHISEPTRLGMISYAVFCLK